MELDINVMNKCLEENKYQSLGLDIKVSRILRDEKDVSEKEQYFCVKVYEYYFRFDICESIQIFIRQSSKIDQKLILQVHTDHYYLCEKELKNAKIIAKKTEDKIKNLTDQITKNSSIIASMTSNVSNDKYQNMFDTFFEKPCSIELFNIDVSKIIKFFITQLATTLYAGMMASFHKTRNFVAKKQTKPLASMHISRVNERIVVKLMGRALTPMCPEFDLVSLVLQIFESGFNISLPIDCDSELYAIYFCDLMGCTIKDESLQKIKDGQKRLHYLDFDLRQEPVHEKVTIDYLVDLLW